EDGRHVQAVLGETQAVVNDEDGRRFSSVVLRRDVEMVFAYGAGIDLAAPFEGSEDLALGHAFLRERVSRQGLLLLLARLSEPDAAKRKGEKANGNPVLAHGTSSRN